MTPKAPADVRTAEAPFSYSDDEALFRAADEVCRRVHGNKVLLRGLIEFSNHCTMDCAYCGIRRSNGKADRYRLSEEEVLDLVGTAFERGLRTFVLQSGEDPEYSPSRVADLVRRIKEKTRGEAAVTLSCGILPRRELKNLREAGADRYLLRFETSDPALYSRLKGGEKLERRLAFLKALAEEGFQAGSGFMTGLPGETEETRENNIRLCAELKLDMVGIGPFIPHPETPLGKAPQESLLLTLRAAARVRLALPECHIPATTAAGSLDPAGRERMLEVGANVLMPNLTPPEAKQLYLLYPGKICLDEPWTHCLGCLDLRVRSIGKVLSYERGDAPRLAGSLT